MQNITISCPLNQALTSLAWICKTAMGFIIPIRYRMTCARLKDGFQTSVHFIVMGCHLASWWYRRLWTTCVARFREQRIFSVLGFTWSSENPSHGLNGCFLKRQSCLGVTLTVNSGCEMIKYPCWIDNWYPLGAIIWKWDKQNPLS